MRACRALGGARLTPTTSHQPLVRCVRADGTSRPRSVTVAFAGLVAGSPTEEYHLTGSRQHLQMVELNGVALVRGRAKSRLV
jgi:hypothetical protein